jgi:uncharacterized membrane protein
VVVVVGAAAAAAGAVVVVVVVVVVVMAAAAVVVFRTLLSFNAVLIATVLLHLHTDNTDTSELNSTKKYINKCTMFTRLLLRKC